MTNSPALATLVARCQAALESSDPRTEVVAALEDLVANPAELLEQLGTPGLDGPATGIDETIHEDDLLTVMICHTRPGLDQPPHDAEGETPYYLETRHLALSVEGALDRMQKLLGKLHATDRLVHSAAMTIRRADGESNNVSLDIDLVLFNLLLKSAVET